MDLKKKKVLIAGDSFATDWTKKYEGIGWVNMLENDFDVTNVAQAGVSEYKIHKQLQSVNVDEYDYVIVSHTSAYRIPVKEHPIHWDDKLHNQCDLIYSDLKNHEYNDLVKIGVDFYENLFDVDYFVYIHKLILNDINQNYPNIINITFFDSFNQIDGIVNLEKVFHKNGGLINHLNDRGNEIVYKKILSILN
jgi:hypothetical protein